MFGYGSGIKHPGSATKFAVDEDVDPDQNSI
jgi:hypothetical protein